MSKFQLIIFLMMSILMSTKIQAATLEALDVSHDSDGYHLNVEMLLDAPARKVRAILMDYSRLDRLNESIIKSDIALSKDTDLVRVRTQLKNCVAFFCSTVDKVEDIYLDKSGTIHGSIIPELSDFESGLSMWQILDDEGGTRIIHTATLKPSIQVPPLLGPHLIKKLMRKEIIASLTNLEALSKDEFS